MESDRSTSTTLGPGSILADEWRLDSLLATGSTSEVYAATHRGGRRHALKLLHPALTAEPSARAALLALAYLPNQIPHEGVIHTLEDGVTADGGVFTSMELIEAETLSRRWLAEGRRLRPTLAVELALAVLEVLAATHERQVVHGALSLDHVLLARGGRVRLCGLGSSSAPRLAREETTLSFDVGTSPFIAPEQALGTGPTLRSDLFAVAAMTFALVTGASVLDGAGKSFKALSSLAAPVALVLDRALAFDPAARWPSAMAMREALGEAASEAVRVKTGPQTAFPANEHTLVSASQPGPTRLRGVPTRLVSDGAVGAESPASDASAAPVEEPAASPVAVPPPRPSASTTARRSSTVIAVSGIDRAGAAVLGARAASAGLRFEPVLADAALVLPTSLSEPREEILDLAPFALEMAQALPAASISIVTGVDLLGDQTDTNAALRLALTRKPGAGRSPIRLDAAGARIVEAHFEVSWDPTGPTLVGERAPDGGFRRLLGRPTAFVGRDADIAELSAFFSKAVAHEAAQGAVVVAAAGLGKSRLVEEVTDRIRARHPEVEAWSVAADPMRRGVAFGVAAQLVTRAAGVPRDDGPEARREAIRDRAAAELPIEGGRTAADVARIAELLAEIAGVGAPEPASPQVRRARRDAASMGDQLRFAFLDFVGAVVAKRPLLFVIEDLQWADAASVELFGHALSLLKPRPWAILATARPEVDEVYPRLWTSVRKALVGLDDASLASIARAARAAAPTLTDSEVARAVSAARGNPLLLEEVLRARVEAQRMPEGAELDEIVRSRVEALDPAAREVLSQASVFGGVFSLAGVAELLARATTGGPSGHTSAQVAAAIDELVHRELVVARPRRRGASEYAFRHACVREVAYARLVQGERVAAHRSAGVFLERQGERQSAVLAEHFARANAAEQAAAWYERSAAEALERSDITQTLDLARRGLEYRPRADVASSLLAMLAECHVWRLEYGDARRAATEVIARTPRGSALFCRALASLATALTRGGDPEAAIKLATSVLSDVPSPADKPAFASAITALVASFLRLGRHDLVRALMERATVLADEPGADPATIAHVESARSWCAMFAGDFSECLRHDREVVRRFQEACDLRNACRETSSIGYDLMVLGAYEDAEHALKSALATGERLGIARVVAGAKHHLSLVTLRLGRLDEAHQLALEALELGRASSDPFALGSMRLYLGIVLAARGDDLGAARALEDAIVGFVATPAAQAWPLAELALVRLSEGRLQEAWSSAEAALGVVAATGPAEEGDAVIRLAHAEVLARLGRTIEAKASVERALRRLHERCKRISDATLKQSFMHRVSEHARTIALARALGVAVDG